MPRVLTSWGDLEDDEPEQQLVKAEPEVQRVPPCPCENKQCTICGQTLLIEGTPPGHLVCRLHGTRGVRR